MKKAGTDVGNSTSFAYETLPTNYNLYKRIDLTAEKRIMTLLCIWTIIAIVAMIVPMLFLHPLKNAVDMPIGQIIFCVAAMIVGLIVYIFLHEGVHGIFIKLFTGTNASFGMDLKNGMAYAGSTWYFKKWPYVIIALAPLVIWGIALAILLKDIQESYFWYLYAIQIFNVIGAAGDLYITCEIAKMPKNVLAFDSGTAMDFYCEVSK